MLEKGKEGFVILVNKQTPFLSFSLITFHFVLREFFLGRGFSDKERV